jgi:hypothetical protein
MDLPALTLLLIFMMFSFRQYWWVNSDLQPFQLRDGAGPSPKNYMDHIDLPALTLLLIFICSPFVHRLSVNPE